MAKAKDSRISVTPQKPRMPRSRMAGGGHGSGSRWQTQESFTVARLPRCGIPKLKDWTLQRAAVTLAGVGGRPQRAAGLVAPRRHLFG
jgi:hypothetical protein